MKAITGVLITAMLISYNAYALEGEGIYNQTCIACHGGDGKGVMPGVPDFTVYKERLSKPDPVLIKNMRDGYQSEGSPMAMPAKGGNSSLNDDDLLRVLNYMRSKFNN